MSKPYMEMMGYNKPGKMISSSEIIDMVITEKIQQYVQKLPSSFQIEVLDFVEYLLNKAELEREWSELSLSLAMRGMEDEDSPTYTTSDLKVRFS